MTQGPIAAVMVHVDNVGAALEWYAHAFPQAARRRVDEIGFDYLEVDGVQLEMVPADDKVRAGAAGSVVYWRVADFERALAHLQAIGATLCRGPLPITDGQAMCQVRDPWGNCIGLRGPGRTSPR